ncbi:MAG: hypothetical protein ROO76_09225 [Terriglobia bacterium]|nr:hypothetical protein [Terriglobia bacterium]
MTNSGKNGRKQLGLVKKERLTDLQCEAAELLALFSAFQLTAKGRRRSIVNDEIVNRK